MSPSGSRFAALLAILAVIACSAPPEPPSAAPPRLHFAVLDNHQEGPRSFRAELTLTNPGPWTLGQDWTLYFNFGRMILPESLPDAVRVTHINGDFFQLTPSASFTPLGPDESLRIPFDAENWIVKETEAPAGAYLVMADDQAPLPVEVTVEPFRTPQQTDRMKGDLIPVPTAASRFEDQRGLVRLPPEDVSRIVPTPVRVRRGSAAVRLDGSWTIRAAAGLDTEATYLAEALEPLLGQRLDVVPGDEAAPGSILLRLAAAGAEAYRLEIGQDSGIVITGSDAAGVFYGVQSLRAWMPVEAYRSVGAVTLDETLVEDAPRFGYRGLHLDVARNFQSKATVLKLLDLMAFYKLNRFHFHLSDDEGWRLEIPGLPELTEVGARRGHTTDESDRLVPSFGSGPDPEGSHGSGFYSRSDFVEILRHADERHIRVIPEIDVPGHARAAIKAMQARGDQDFRLVDPDDTSQYMSVQMWKDNVIDVCLDSTYRFLRTVASEIVAMYADAGAPLDRLHTGGDEVPKGVWEASPACERMIRDTQELDSVEDLSAFFLHRMSGILAEHDVALAGWEEIALLEETDGENTVKAPHPELVRLGLKPYVWNNVWGWGAEDLAYRLANAGYEIVLSNATNLYFDLAYDKDPAEPGYYWAGFTDTRTAWEMVPFDVFQNAHHDLFGNPFAPGTFADRERLTDEGRRRILGIQGQLWGENAKGRERMEYLAFPKVLGLAERAWAASPAWAESEDPTVRRQQIDDAWRGFANSVGQRELPRLDRLYGGVAYRLPPPGAVIEGGELRANVAFPGLEIRYTVDGSEPTAESLLYTEPIEVDGSVRLKSFDTRGRGSRMAVAGAQD